MTHEDHDVIVERDGSGTGAGVIAGVIVVLALVFVLWFLALGPGRGAFGGNSKNPDINVNVSVPTAQPHSS